MKCGLIEFYDCIICQKCICSKQCRSIQLNVIEREVEIYNLCLHPTPYKKIRALEQGIEIHHRLNNIGILLDVAARIVLVGKYAKFISRGKAHKLFDIIFEELFDKMSQI